MDHFYDLRKYLFMLKRSCREVLSSVDLKTANSNEPDQYWKTVPLNKTKQKKIRKSAFVLTP